VIETVVRLLFDECYSPGLRDELQQFFGPEYPKFEFHHILDNYSPSTEDRVWLEPLTNQPDWIVITKDAGRVAKTERLPNICKEFGVTHLGITSSLINAGYMAKSSP
jgi:hypothetical protein